MQHVFTDFDIFPEEGIIENGEKTIERTKEDLSHLKNETKVQNTLKNQVRKDLNSLNPESLFDTRITIRKRDTLGAMAFGVDGAKTVSGKKELNIDWNTKVEYFNKKGDRIKKTTLLKANKLNIGDVVSFRKEGSKTVIMVNNTQKSPKKNAKKYEKEQKIDREKLVKNEDNEQKIKNFREKAEALIEKYEDTEGKVSRLKTLNSILNERSFIKLLTNEPGYLEDWLKSFEDILIENKGNKE